MIALDLDLSFDDFGDVDQARLRPQTELVLDYSRLLRSAPGSIVHTQSTLHGTRARRG